MENIIKYKFFLSLLVLTLFFISFSYGFDYCNYSCCDEVESSCCYDSEYKYENCKFKDLSTSYVPYNYVGKQIKLYTYKPDENFFIIYGLSHIVLNLKENYYSYKYSHYKNSRVILYEKIVV